MKSTGLIQIYTGDGKGKTTAALGLAMRSAGYGHRVLIYQFLKPATLELGERKFLESQCSCNAIELAVLDEDWNMWKSFDDPAHVAKVKERIHEELVRITEFAAADDYDVIILDELAFCQSQGLASIDDIKKLVETKNPTTELIMTGRRATPELIELADLVSEITLIKHPYDKGVTARKGIEF